ncbi:MAG: hypothetical protein IPI49_20960 [Myxococcales bacterium]|nr:hypothetical protein [Myxococcales bacterium]
MILEDIPGAFQAYEQGDLGRGHLMYLLLDLASSHSVDDVLRHVPAGSVQDFTSELEQFRDEVPLEDISIFSSGTGEPPQKDAIVTTIRAWLRARSSAMP